MLSMVDLEKLIAVKRLEIEKEKLLLGLSSPETSRNIQDDIIDKRAVEAPAPKPRLKFAEGKPREYHADAEETAAQELEGEIPPELDRYIRRYLGLPVMLKAGEYSPNNPLLAREPARGDALLGLGEYERRRHTLRRVRQQQYREYLDQQAKKKQEAKEQAEKERREREEKEREREEREREREREERERERQERERRIRVERHVPEITERRRASENYVGNVGTFSYSNKVDTGVQVDSVTAPLSVAVQTDDADLFRLPSPCIGQITQAERELSPHTVADPWPARGSGDKAERRRSYGDFDERSSTLLKKTNRDKLTSDLRHSYIPSIFDADAIHMRNLQAEKEAAARRQYYQQELKNQIMEQQRIREERKTREKMLEQAEMRRLEEQLRMLRVAQDREIDKQQQMDHVMKEDTIEYEKRRKELQKDIDMEQMKLIRAPLTSTQTSQPRTNDKLPCYLHYPTIDKQPERNIRPIDKDIQEISYGIQRSEMQERNRFDIDEGNRYQEKSSRFSKSEPEKRPYSLNIPDDSIDKQPERNIRPIDKDIQEISYGIQRSEMQERNRFQERSVTQERNRYQDSIDKSSRFSKSEPERKPYSMNIPDDSIFSQNYDVDSYLRKNLNFKDRFEFNRDFDFDSIGQDGVERNIEKVLVHERPKPKTRPIPKERKNIPQESLDSLPIPVLRHSPLNPEDKVEISSNMSDAMKKVDDKWKVPAVQKNLLKNVPNEEGKNVSILTQLGSIRRQLQLEQLKLDRISKDDEVYN